MADYLSSIRFNTNQIAMDAMAKLRTANATTLHDGKSLNVDRTLIWENAGTGTGTFTANKYNMAVGVGQWFIRQTRRFHPYYSGKSQAVELTCDNFNTEPGVIKRKGYFSSNAVSPYDSNYDGFWIEDDGVTKRIVISKGGVETANIPLADWNGEYDFSGYDWEKFTVIKFDFLWLGGAILRMFVMTPEGFKLAHSHIHASLNDDVFILSPNQPVRYEIRSTGGTGSFRMVCSEVESEGSINESGLMRSAHTSTGVACASVGTTYPVLAIRKNSAQRDIAIKMRDVWAFVNTNDEILWTVQLNPTLSAPLTYNDMPSSAAQFAIANGSTTVTTPGIILASGVLMQSFPIVYDAERDFLTYLGGTLSNTMDQLVFCAKLLSAGVLIYAGITYVEY